MSKQKEVQAKARTAVKKAVAQAKAEVVKVSALRKGSRLRRGDGATGVVLCDPAKGAEFALIDWNDGEREGWNNRALAKGKVVKA